MCMACKTWSHEIMFMGFFSLMNGLLTELGGPMGNEPEESS